MRRHLFILAIALCFCYGAADKDFRVVVEKPGVQESHFAVELDFTHFGMEGFDDWRLGYHNEHIAPFEMHNITVIYKDVEIVKRDIFGGAFGKGLYPVARQRRSYSIDIYRENGHGVNFFGFWHSAIDMGNRIDFFRDGKMIFRLTAPDIVQQLIKDDTYLGNPTYNPKENIWQTYAFVNVFSVTKTFDRLVFFQRAYSPFETDNHTIGYYPMTADATTSESPEDNSVEHTISPITTWSAEAAINEPVQLHSLARRVAAAIAGFGVWAALSGIVYKLTYALSS